jgi:hypothetical protein
MSGLTLTGGMLAATVSLATFNVAALNLSGWWRADYAGPPADWDATASAGASMANGPLTNPSSGPDAGPLQNGYTPAEFVAANLDYFTNVTDATGFFTTNAGTTAGTLGLLGSVPLVLGKNYVASQFFDGRMAVFALAKAVPSDADITKLLGVMAQQWGVSL